MAKLYDVARLGRTVELRYTPDGTPVCNLALACDYGRKDQSGNRPTQWVDAALWGKRAEALAQYLVKGQQVLVTIDDVHIEEYQSQGVTRSKLVGNVADIKLVGSAPQQKGQGQQQRPASQQYGGQTSGHPNQQAPQQQHAPNYDDFDDDIPF